MITKLSSIGQKLLRLGPILIPHTRSSFVLRPFLKPYQQRPLSIALPRVSTPLSSFLGANVLPKILPRVANASIIMTTRAARIPLGFVGFGTGAVGYTHMHTNANQTRSYHDSVLQKGLSDITTAEFFSKFSSFKERSENEKGGKDSCNNSKPHNMISVALLGSAAMNEQKEKIQIISPEPVVEIVEPKADRLMALTKKLIQIQTMLQIINRDDTLQLLGIVVIGPQGSGKSSVLEAIVGREFLPKGSNMVQRRPIELTLVNTPDSNEEYVEFPQLGFAKMQDFEQVRKILIDLNLSISDAECISSKPIKIRMHSPNVPDLLLIDLPGFIHIHNTEQPLVLKQKIRDLCDLYISRQSIILAVCSADSDLANSEALLASKRVDPLGVRTIGVVTKMDLVTPESGISILQNANHTLHLGYIGVICKNLEGESKPSGNNQGVKAEEHYFRPGSVYTQSSVIVGVSNLREKLTHTLEEIMRGNLPNIVDRIHAELEDARYHFKVEHKGHQVTAESYVAETMDALKLKFKEFTGTIGKPQVRQELRNLLEERVLDICAEIYWADPRIFTLRKEEADDAYWKHKLNTCFSLLTKSGLGRSGTQIVIDLVMKNMERLAFNGPFLHHPDIRRQIIQLSYEILNSKYQATVDQVENTVKSYNYEVVYTEQEWSDGLKRSIGLLEKELSMCQYALAVIKTTVGKAKLRSTIKCILDSEMDEQRRAANKAIISQEEQSDIIDLEFLDVTKPFLNPALIDKAKEAICLKQRAVVLKNRLATLKDHKYGSQSNKTMCPEVFLNVVAEKLIYGVSMLIQAKLLNSFFLLFPKEVDNRLYFELNRDEIDYFAKENPQVMKQFKLAERKQKLEMAMNKLMYLTQFQAGFETRKYLC